MYYNKNNVIELTKEIGTLNFENVNMNTVFRTAYPSGTKDSVACVEKLMTEALEYIKPKNKMMYYRNTLTVTNQRRILCTVMMYLMEKNAQISMGSILTVLLKIAEPSAISEFTEELESLLAENPEYAYCLEEHRRWCQLSDDFRNVTVLTLIIDIKDCFVFDHRDIRI